MKKIDDNKVIKDRTAANRSIRSRKTKWCMLWLGACIATFLLAAVVYWLPIITSSPFVDKGDTASNILISMSTSGITIFLFQIPEMKKIGCDRIERVSRWIAILCIIANSILSVSGFGKCVKFFSIIITGIGTGSVAIMFMCFSQRIEMQEIHDREWARRYPRKKGR